ncbi:MAG: hypothetical protein WC732_08055 [Candidatus Omnitrophota bacterium]
MDTINTAEIEKKTSLEREGLMLSWKDSPPVQRLLDAIADIIASEYVQIAKQNPDVFLSGGASK